MTELLIVDYGTTGRPLGVEITAPQAVPLERLNQLLADLGEAPLAEQEYQSVRASVSIVSSENGRVRLRFRPPVGATGCAHREQEYG